MEQASPMQDIRVLYVDDEPDIREVAALALGLDPALEVRTCGSGPEALEMAASWSPSVILMDIMMPGMDGPATLAELRNTAEAQDTPVVFISARAQPRDMQRLRALGALGVIGKPFDPMRLSGQLRELLCR